MKKILNIKELNKIKRSLYYAGAGCALPLPPVQIEFLRMRAICIPIINSHILSLKEMDHISCGAALRKEDGK